MRRRIDLQDNRRYVEDLPDHRGPLDADIVDTDEGINGGHIWPRHDESTNSWVEGASQTELDLRAEHIVRQGLVQAAKDKLTQLREDHKELDLSLDIIEAVTFRLGKAAYLRSQAIAAAELASRQAHQAFVVAAPTATALNLKDLLVELCTQLGAQEQNKRLAELDYQAALDDIKQALNTRS